MAAANDAVSAGDVVVSGGSFCTSMVPLGTIVALMMSHAGERAGIKGAEANAMRDRVRAC